MIEKFEKSIEKMSDFLVKPLELSYARQVPSKDADPDKVIVIYHGITANKYEWTGIARKIADQTKRMVYCFDIRDHGGKRNFDHFCAVIF